VGTAREERLTRAFVDLADTLVDDFDVVELLHQMVEQCVSLLGASAAGILLADAKGGLRVMAASSEQSRLLEIFQLQAHEGPCLDSYASGAVVAVGDLAVESRRWPRFAAEARLEGIRSVSAERPANDCRVAGITDLRGSWGGRPWPAECVAVIYRSSPTIVSICARATRRS
jgi:hypothetical protein